MYIHKKCVTIHLFGNVYDWIHVFVYFRSSMGCECVCMCMIEYMYCVFKISHGLCMIEYMYDFDFANIWISFKCQHLNAWICPCDSCIIGLFYAHIWMSNLKSCIHSLRFFSPNNSNVMNALPKKSCAI